MSVTADDPVSAAPAPLPPAAPTSAWAGWVLTGVCVLTPVVAYLGNLGFAPLLALAGLLCLPLALRSRAPNLGMAMLVALAAWGVVSMTWSLAAPVNPDFHRYKTVEQLTVLKLVFELPIYGAFLLGVSNLSQRAGERTGLALAVGLAAISALFLIEAMLKAPLYQWIRAAVGEPTNPPLAMRDVSRVAYVLALLFWPVTIAFQRRGWTVAAAALALATVVGAFLLNADAPVAALIVSSLVFAAVRFAGRPAVLVLLAGVVIYFLAAPLIIHVIDRGQLIHPAADDIRIQSWAIRLDIWRFAAARIAERPFQGWGLDSARMFSPNIPLHTHSAAIQLWLELGVVGAALTAAFWAWIVLRIDQVEAMDRTLAATSAAAASAYLTIGALSFGVWQDWWIALGVLTAAACIALGAARRGEPTSRSSPPPKPP